MTENPERLWAFVVRGAVYADLAEGRLQFDNHRGWGATGAQEYVRADIAAAEKADAVDRAVGVACCRPTHLGGEIGQTDRCGECFVCLREEASAAVALRLEKAALVAERDALRLALRTIRASGVGVAVDLASVALAGGPP